ncbi:hypothetical protein AAKU67_003150 [Oxalobacteraceae bacterium GrIS 2.11]
MKKADVESRLVAIFLIALKMGLVGFSLDYFRIWSGGRLMMQIFAFIGTGDLVIACLLRVMNFYDE